MRPFSFLEDGVKKIKDHRMKPGKHVKPTHKAGKQPVAKGRTFNTPARPK